MENSNKSTNVKASSVPENKGLSAETISEHLDKIRESKEKLEIIQAKAAVLEKTGWTNSTINKPYFSYSIKNQILSYMRSDFFDFFLPVSLYTKNM